jgi:hypothetical protein
MAQNEEPVPVIRKMLPYTTFAILVALLYLGWVFYSRWHENRMLQQQAAAKEQAEAKRIYDMYGAGQVKILQLYANPGVVSHGGTAQLCYGVSNAKTINISPKPTGDVWPSIARCVDVTPSEDTTYVLTAQDANGHSETANVTIQVR